MDDQKRAQEMFGQLTGKAVETMTVWADANQRVLRELVELSTATAKEGVRLCGELQQGALETLRSSQSAAAHWQSAWANGSTASRRRSSSWKVRLKPSRARPSGFSLRRSRPARVSRRPILPSSRR